MSWFKKYGAGEKKPVVELNNTVRISEILALGAVKVNLESTEKDEVFEELVDLLVRSGGVKDRDAALAAVRCRETLGSTGIGDGVAIPHGKDATVSALVAALGLSHKGVEFGAVDGKPAKLIFLLLARSDNPGPHIQALAEIAQLVQTPKFVERLLAAKSPREVLDIIRSEE